MRVRVSVCEFGELSADAGSLGHLASAKEKGKLLQRCGAGEGGGESKLLGQIPPVSFVTTSKKAKAAAGRLRR